MSRRAIGFTVSSSASDGHRKSWLGIKPWQWSKFKLKLTEPLLFRSDHDTRVLLQWLFYGLGGVIGAAAFIIHLAYWRSYEPRAEEAQATSAQHLISCIEQTGERKICQANYVMQGGTIPVRQQK